MTTRDDASLAATSFGLPRWFSWLAKALLGLLGLLVFASLAACGGCGNTKSTGRAKACTPPEWDDEKWQHVTTGKMIRLLGEPRSVEDEERAALIESYRRLDHTVPSPPGQTLKRGSIIMVGEHADPDYVPDAEALAKRFEALSGNDPDGLANFSFESFHDNASKTSVDTGASSVESAGPSPEARAASDEPSAASDEASASPEAETDAEQPSSEAEPEVEHLGEIQSAISEAGPGTPNQPVYLSRSPVVALRLRYSDGATGWATGFAWSENIVVTVGHILYSNRQLVGVDILPPASADAPNMQPLPITGLAYQAEAEYTPDQREDGNDISIIYHEGQLPLRVMPQAPIMDYQPPSMLNCPTPGNCTSNTMTLAGTFTAVPAEEANPRIRMGQTVIYAERNEDHGSMIYAFPPIVDHGDSGGPAYVDGQIIGVIAGTDIMPIDYDGQTHSVHYATRVNPLSGTQIQRTIERFRANMRAFADTTNWWGRPAIPQAPYHSADRRFGVLVDYDQQAPVNTALRFTFATLRAALAALHLYGQLNPPHNGCGP